MDNATVGGESEQLVSVQLHLRYDHPMSPSDQKFRPIVRRLRAEDDIRFAEALDLFALAFDDLEDYCVARPSINYRSRLLSKSNFILLVAIANERTIGALAAYELEKFEQERSEFYIYDLAVSPEWRRQAIATSLISHLQAIAAKHRSGSIFVQADYGDEPAIALYTKLGTREDVIHFDIPAKN